MTNGSFGMPGTRPIAAMMPPAIMGARGWRRIWSVMSDPRSASLPERVTMMPVAVEIRSAGIWAARPSPIVRSGKVWTASENDMPRCSTPTTMPPSRLMATIRMPAMASPLTNLDAPSIAP